MALPPDARLTGAEARLAAASAGDAETPRFYGTIRRVKVDVNYLHRVIRTLDIKSTLETNR